MHKGKRGVLFVFSGPSGVGKGTLKAKLFEEFADQIAYSVSATTRGPREGEVDGKDYFFISRQEFDRRVKNNEFLEHAEFAGNCYGTPRAYVEKLLDSGMNVVLEIDVSVRNGATGQTIQDLEFRYENELIASVESVNARSSTLVETNVVPQTSTLNAPNKCPCILRFSCMIFSLSAKTGGYGLTQFSCPANALYGAGLK